MKSAKQLIGSVILRQGLKYIEKNPMENLPKLINWVEKFDRDKHYGETYNMFRKIAADSNNNWNLMIRNVFKDLHSEVLNKFITNFILNSGILGITIAEEARRKHQCNVPWAILMDPTAACNLKCTGCWAAEYSKTASMDIETLDRIIREGKELGVYFYIYSGGEPLVRKDDLVKLAKKHNDCSFLSFTNGTLIDEDLAKELQKVGNFGFAISVEGFEEETDMRRGKGTYEKVIRAMDISKEYGLPFGFSTCWHSKNTHIVGSEEYVDLMVEKGCKFGWYFTYMPIGKNAVLDLLATPEQREFMYHQIRKFRETKPIFLMDFWNDGEYVNGCIAGGRNYLHINANGDVEPCAFIHYSNVNIKDVSLLEALKSPLFMQYRENQPFNDNHLRPCPCLDNPEKLREMVHKAGAVSTQLIDKESVDDLTDKCKDAAEKWAVTADKLWDAHLKRKNEEAEKATGS